MGVYVINGAFVNSVLSLESHEDTVAAVLATYGMGETSYELTVDRGGTEIELEYYIAYTL